MQPLGHTPSRLPFEKHLRALLCCAGLLVACAEASAPDPGATDPAADAAAPLDGVDSDDSSPDEGPPGSDESAPIGDGALDGSDTSDGSDLLGGGDLLGGSDEGAPGESPDVAVDRSPDPGNAAECPALSPENPVGDCLGLPIYLTCGYKNWDCVCDWYHWLCV